MYSNIALYSHVQGDRNHNTELLVCKLPEKETCLIVRTAVLAGVKVFDDRKIITYKGNGSVQKNFTLRTDQPDGCTLIGGQIGKIFINLLAAVRGPVGADQRILGNLGGFPVKLFAIYRFYMFLYESASCQGDGGEARQP